MSIDERKRHALYERLDEVLDGEHADTLMELLPPVGWADVATKQDVSLLQTELRALEDRMDSKLASLELRMMKEMNLVRDELHGSLRTQTWSILGVLTVAILINQAASHLL
jgi:hypothetical protein